MNSSLSSASDPAVHEGSEARGQTRLALAACRADHDAFMARLGHVSTDTISGLAMKGAVGRDRARHRLITTLGRQPFMETPRALCWRLLYPRENPVEGGDRHGIEVLAVVCGLLRGEPSIDAVPFGLFVSAHAGAQAHNRSGGRINFRTMVVDTHDALLRAPVDMFDAASNQQNWCMPSSGGALLTQVRIAGMATRTEGTDRIAIVTGETWISRDQLWPDQEAQLLASSWPGPGERLGTSLLLPAPLRPLVQTGSGLVLLPEQIDPKQRATFK